MLTAVNDAPTATEALSRGAMGYLTKPVELPDLHESILKALHRREMLLQQREIDHVIREEVTLRTAELEREKSALRDLTIQVAESLVIAMEAKNPYMRGRSIRIGEMAAAIADEMQLDVDTVEAVRLAARLMDVGKIGIREEILNKPGSLTPEEYAHVKQHVEMGLHILAPMKHLGAVLDYVRDHHEHFDGTGYPRQLCRVERSRSAAASSPPRTRTTRCVTGRSYQEPLDANRTLDYLGERVGTLIDPARVRRAQQRRAPPALAHVHHRRSRTDLERTSGRRARVVHGAQMELASVTARLFRVCERALAERLRVLDHLRGHHARRARGGTHRVRAVRRAARGRGWQHHAARGAGDRGPALSPPARVLRHLGRARVALDEPEQSRHLHRRRARRRIFPS